MNSEQKTDPRKQFGFCLHEQCCKLINHLCNSDGPHTLRGYVFHSKDKSRMLPGILKDSGSTWQPDLELMISREIFNESEFLIISKVQKLTQSSWEQSGAGKVQSPGSSYNPIPTEIWAVLLCKTLLQKRSSIEKKIHLQWAEQSLPTESCQFSCD